MGSVQSSILSSFESQLSFCLESFLMSLGHRRHGKKVRKVRPGMGAHAPKQIGSQPTFHPPTPHSLYLGRSWDSRFLTTLGSKKRKGTPPVIFKKEIHKSLHRF